MKKKTSSSEQTDTTVKKAPAKKASAKKVSKSAEGTEKSAATKKTSRKRTSAAGVPARSLSKGTKFESAESARALRGWKLFDAKDKVVGRLATEIATVLRGKNKPQFSPHNDCGDFVVVINADKVKLTGAKLDKKFYYKHTGFVGNLKTETAGSLLAKKPQRVLEAAVKGMLPKTALGRKQFKKMKIYTGDKHPHQAQFAAK